MKKLYRNCLFKLAITPFTYIICGAAVVFAVLNFFLLQRFFTGSGSSDLHRFFSGIPYICTLAVPALGSFIPHTKEDLSVPYRAPSLIAAKTLALLTVSGIPVILTLFVPAAVSWFGNVEFSPLVTAYSALMLYLLSTCSFSVLLYTAVESTGFAFILQSAALLAVNTAHLISNITQPGDFVSTLLKSISFSWHFDAAGKGIIDTRDIIFFLSSAAIFLLGGTAALELKRGRATAFMKRTALLSIAAFILLSADSSRLYLRVDTTSAKKFSVSGYSKALIDEIREPMSITYYRSPSLKNIYPEVRDIEDFLHEYASQSSFISCSVVDPSKDNVKEKLSAYGIQGQRIRTTEKDTTSYTTVYSTVIISYLGEIKAVPFVLSASSLEFSMAEKIDCLVRENTRLVQVVVGNGLSFDDDYGYIKPWLETQGFYAVQTYLPSEIQDGKAEVFSLFPEVPLIVLGTSLFTQEDSEALMNFIRRNGKVIIATNPYTVDIKKDWTVIPVSDYVLYGLQEFGIYYRDTITSGKENFTIGLYTQNAAGETVPSEDEYAEYSMWPLLSPQENADNGLYAFWPSAIDFDNEVASDSNAVVAPYLHTGKNAWQSTKVNGKFITNPFSASKEPEEGEETGQFNIAVSASRPGEKTPFLIATGDQYAFTSQMIGYTSSTTGIDARSLDFLAESLMSVSGEKSLLELKRSSKTNTELYKVTQENLSGAKIPVLAFTILIPLLMLAVMAWATASYRKKLSMRLLK